MKIENRLHTEFVRTFPNSAGNWNMSTTGETARAVEMEDIQGHTLFAVFIGEDGPFFDCDLQGEIFEKINQ